MNAALRRENVNAVYLPLAAHNIEELIACVRELPIHGLSVTMPYKEQIIGPSSTTPTSLRRKRTPAIRWFAARTDN